MVDVPLADGDFAGYVGIGDGRRLYLECHGSGSPTVILEAGLRSRSDFWSERTDETVGPTVFLGIARFTGLRLRPTGDHAGDHGVQPQRPGPDAPHRPRRGRRPQGADQGRPDPRPHVLVGVRPAA